MRPSQKENEAYWITSLHNGEDPALAHFFDLHYKSLCYFAGRIIQDDTEAEDIVADCFLKFWERHNDFDSYQNIKAFLYISCRNACLNHIKHLKVKTIVQQEYFSQLQQGEETILFQIMETEVLEILHTEIEELPGKCKEVFKLIYFDGKKTEKIAEELGISAQTVRNHKTRAIELLKTSMLKKGISATVMLGFLLLVQGK